MASTTVNGGLDFTYNWDNKLRQVKQDDSTIMSVKYDPDGNRIFKDSGETGQRKYIVDIAADLPVILIELNNSGDIVKTYIYANSQIIAQHTGDHEADRYFYLHDRLGSVRQLIDTAGNVVHLYTYEPFGEVLESDSAQGAPSNAFMFTGQYFDSEIDQYYLRARQYDPHISRFTSRDPVSGKFEEPLTLHAYLYCGNDPLNRVDSRGEIFGLVSSVLGITIGEACRRSETYAKYAVYGYAVGAIGLIYEVYMIPETIEKFKNSKLYKNWKEYYEAWKEIEDIYGSP
jgi:RHS repeat-associated protein